MKRAEKGSRERSKMSCVMFCGIHAIQFRLGRDVMIMIRHATGDAMIMQYERVVLDIPTSDSLH